MSAEFFIMLLNPGIGALLSAAFLLLWLSQRGKSYILHASIGYGVNAFAFFLQDIVFQYFVTPLPGSAERIFTNLVFLFSGWLLAAAVIGRYGLKPSYRFLVVITAAGIGGLAWFLLADPSVIGRILVMNAALGSITLMIVLKLRPVRKRHLIDRLLYGMAVISAANYILRPAAILAVQGGFGAPEDFQHSLYWTTVQFTQPLISIGLALNLMVAIAIDLIEELRREARTDKLSGLLNRGGFETAAAAMIGRKGAGANLPVCLIIADLDHFKQINDTFGHSVGDAVIGLFGRHISAMASEGMVAGRIGGEEFAILLPGHEVQAARLFAESLRACPWDYWSGMLPDALSPSVSIGVCAAQPEIGLHALMNMADEALYDAKKAGRNQVCIYGARPPATATLHRIKVPH
jgi:diguanylate cyclase (GGDEF)-like protein